MGLRLPDRSRRTLAAAVSQVMCELALFPGAIVPDRTLPAHVPPRELVAMAQGITVLDALVVGPSDPEKGVAGVAVIVWSISMSSNSILRLPATFAA